MMWYSESPYDFPNLYPCYFLDEQTRPDDTAFYPLEDYVAECPEITITDGYVQYDSKYLSKNVQGTPSQYDIQLQSGVIDTLASQPLYDQYVPNSQTEKESLYYTFIYTSGIQWKVECDQDGNDYPTR